MAGERWEQFVDNEEVKKDLRSDYLKAKAHSAEQPNFCPYGCEKDELNEHGYCRHLVGFTVPGDNRTFHPRKYRAYADGRPVDMDSQEWIDGRDPLVVLPTDKLEQVTVSSRVYRDVDKYDPPSNEPRPYTPPERKLKKNKKQPQPA